MADVLAYHPATDATAVVSQQALDHHLRNAGWMTRDEWDEYQARLAEREQEPPAAKTASKEK